MYLQVKYSPLISSCENMKPGPEVIKHFSCSTQLRMKFQLLIKTKMLTFLAFKLSDIVFIMLINVKMPTNIGILLFEHDTFHTQLSFIISGPEQTNEEIGINTRMQVCSRFGTLSCLGHVFSEVNVMSLVLPCYTIQLFYTFL